MNKKFNGDPIIEDLRKRYSKSGPDPKPGESIDSWADRFMKYVREKHGLEEKTK